MTHHDTHKDIAREYNTTQRFNDKDMESTPRATAHKIIVASLASAATSPCPAPDPRAYRYACVHRVAIECSTQPHWQRIQQRNTRVSATLVCMGTQEASQNHSGLQHYHWLMQGCPLVTQVAVSESVTAACMPTSARLSKRCISACPIHIPSHSHTCHIPSYMPSYMHAVTAGVRDQGQCHAV